ncbi:DoxX family protein [Flavobacterium sp. MK4S-17]|uniref:DoxX family protein n=1 Tax=Flavobacterium sp. MK4S-17 TaxID=2543737 RepID=UPI00135B2DA9|nr:DoxX family protein [Flavobacterium sp. MK4S-17]
MIGVFNTTYNKNLYDVALLILRLGVGCFMMTHGLQKLNLIMEPGTAQFIDPIGIGESATLSLAVFSELVCSFLIIMGFATRLAVIPLIITMLVAVFVVHDNDAFNEKELGSLYLVIYILLLVVGSGRYSVDQLISGRKRKVNY